LADSGHGGRAAQPQANWRLILEQCAVRGKIQTFENITAAVRYAYKAAGRK